MIPSIKRAIMKDILWLCNPLERHYWTVERMMRLWQLADLLGCTEGIRNCATWLASMPYNDDTRGLIEASSVSIKTKNYMKGQKIYETVSKMQKDFSYNPKTKRHEATNHHTMYNGMKELKLVAEDLWVLSDHESE